MAKKLIIKGVGTMMAKWKDAGGEEQVLTLGTLQNLKIDMNSEAEDIFGGDGTFPIDSLVKSKSIEITGTDAKFDLAAVSVMLGDSLEENVASYVWELNEIHEADASGKISLQYAVYSGADSDISIYEVESNTRITGSNTVSGKDVTNTGMAGKKVYVNYKRASDVDLVRILKDTSPFPVHVVHHGAFMQKNGKLRGIETELFSCKAKGNFTIDAQRAAASASTVTLQIHDPEMECGMIGTIKVFEMDKTVCTPG
ncbi:hypothetical protein DCCM_0380 [Desulfocucumis palustris]|uniref:Uncharacterized protein n=1 Tax=Desulfocucumis palustris TaxID=1898651 RepID=A0A2L2X7M4_9FIRM|nr:hypothetical protein [Desulfocucumis palustris]GBF32189.1 hypothetical protein DCCM_0380 [Desulfocucumis palustris]